MNSDAERIFASIEDPELLRALKQDQPWSDTAIQAGQKLGLICYGASLTLLGLEVRDLTRAAMRAGEE